MERLREQFRETSQRGQASDYGGDRIEDSAVAGGRFVRRRVTDLLKRKNSKQPDHPEEPQSKDLAPRRQANCFSDSPNAPRTDAGTSNRNQPPRIKTRETVSREPSLASDRPASARTEAQRSAYPPQIKTKEAVRENRWVHRKDADKFDSYPTDKPAEQGSPRIFRNKSSEIKTSRRSPADEPAVHPSDGPTAPTVHPPKPPDIKTRDTYVRRQRPKSEQPPTEPAFRQGKQRFIQDQGRKSAVKQSEGPRQNLTGSEARPVSQQRTDSSITPFPSQRQHGGDNHPRSHHTARRTVHRAEKAAERTARNTARSIKASKKAAKDTGRAAKQAVKTASRSTKQAVKTADRTVRTAQKTAQATIKATQRVVQAVRATAKAAAITAKAAAKATVAAIKAAIAAIQELIGAIAAGGWVAIVVVLVICLAAFLIASPFGIFFSGEDSGSGLTMPEAVVQLNGEFTSQIEQIQTDNPHDALDLDNAGTAAMISNWNDVLAVYAVRVSTDETSPGSVAVVTEENLAVLREIFWEMNQISYLTESKDRTETITNEDGEEEEVTATETILHITVTTKDCWQMADEYGFTEEQREMLTELLKPEYQEMFLSLTGSYQNIALSPQEVVEIMERLPEDLSEERRQVVLTAYQLLGKVNYFWGGKSLVLGWDSRWGTPMEVWAAGSPSTGSVRPYGLDCSGFADWVFYNASGGSYVIGHGGGASAQHSYCTDISWSEAVPGDLVFYPGDSHVGIVCGFDISGNVQIIHCASGANNVVVTGKSGFSSIGRPNYYSE